MVNQNIGGGGEGRATWDHICVYGCRHVCKHVCCPLYTSDPADEGESVVLGVRGIFKKKRIY